MFTPSHFAYLNVRNFVCAQIAFTKEKISQQVSVCTYAFENDPYLEDRKEELETYKKILNLLTDNKMKLQARER